MLQMEFLAITPVLRVAHLDTALRFYREVLGFSLIWKAAEEGAETAMLEAGRTSLMLSTGSHLGENPAFTGTLYFEVKGVRGIWEQLKNKVEVEVVWPLGVTDHETIEFGIRDADGYMLAFAEQHSAEAART